MLVESVRLFVDPVCLQPNKSAFSCHFYVVAGSTTTTAANTTAPHHYDNHHNECNHKHISVIKTEELCSVFLGVNIVMSLQQLNVYFNLLLDVNCAFNTL